MTVNRLTFLVKVELLDGQTAEVKLNKFLSRSEKIKIEREFFSDMKMSTLKTMEAQGELQTTKMLQLIHAVEDAVWADKNYSIDDVNPDSLGKVVIDNFDTFLGDFGFSKKVPSSNSNQPGTN